MRREKSISPEEFWASDEPKRFRLHANSQYAEVHKFKRWILEHIEKKLEEPSYDEQVDAEFGVIEDRDDYSVDYQIDNDSPVFKINRRKLHAGDKKWKPKTRLDEDFKPAERLDDKYLLKNTLLNR